jgi:hypothetical protein
MAFVTAYSEKAVLEATALQVGLEFPVDMVGQGFALLGQLLHQGREVRFDELVEKCLLGLMPFVGNIARAIPALCQHAGSAQRDRTNQPVTDGWTMPRPKKPPSLARFIRCGGD